MTSLAFFGEPRVPRLSRLLDEIRAGEIRVPRFQRPFVWTDDQRLALMESIYSGYPIGAILVWRTQKHRLVTYEHLGPLRLPVETGDATIRQYLIDGHQRLATLFAALGPGLYDRGDAGEPEWAQSESEEERVRWPIYFNLESDGGNSIAPADPSKARPFRLARRREKPPELWLPVKILFDSYRLREFEEQLKALGYDRTIINRVQAVADIFRDYPIPVMPIATEDLKRVTTSFKRINSGGTPMSEVHMVNALVWSQDFDLLERIDELSEGLKPVGWEQFDPQMILNVCKARLGVALYDEAPEELADRFRTANPDVLEHVREDIIKVARVLEQIAGIRGPAILPYAYQAVLLADALRDIENPSDTALLDRLRLWFWATTLAEYFRGMTKALFERARQHLQDLVRGTGDPHPPDLSPIVDPIRRFDFRSARCRAIALLLAEQQALHLADKTDDPRDVLAQFGTEALAKPFTPRDVGITDRDAVQGPENRFLIHPKRARWLEGTLKAPIGGGEAQLAGHVVDDQAFAALRRKEWGEFLFRRRASLENLERLRAEECDLKYRDRIGQ